MSDMDTTNPTVMHNLLLVLYLIQVLNAYQELLPRSEEDEYDGGGENLVYLGKRLFQNPNSESGNKLKEWNDTWDINPEEMGDYVEGDIAFPKELEKNGLVIEAARWPNAIIPYEIKGDFSPGEMGTIKRVMNLYEAKTCIKFRPRQPSNADWINILSNDEGCWSSVGRKGGPQTVNLQVPYCLKRLGTVIHEFLHVVGFIHQQSTWNRNKYVKVKWRNIKEGRENDFIKRSRSTVTNFGVPYDYHSVMHYSKTAFTKNGEPTLIPKARSATIGQRRNFSRRDIQKILLMYKCRIRTKQKTSSTNGQGKPICTLIFIILSQFLILS